MSKRPHGFTLIELLVVIAILAILAAMLLAGAGSVASSPDLVIAAGATLQAASGLTIGAAQTLKGGGTVVGNTLVNGRVEPGASHGALTVTGNLTLAGTTFIELSKSPFTNDQLVATCTIAYGGILSLTNLSATPLAAGDSFKLFTAPACTGSFASLTPTTPGTGLAWDTSSLITNGTLRIVAAVSQKLTNLTFAVNGNVLTLTCPSNHTGWTLQTQTNPLMIGLSSNWVGVPGSAGTRVIGQCHKLHIPGMRWEPGCSMGASWRAFVAACITLPGVATGGALKPACPVI